MTEGLGLEDGLFEIEAPPPVSLQDRFGMPPFSILDRRGGAWQERKRRWLSLGIRSELGRDGGLIYDTSSGMGQGVIPIHLRDERSLEAAALGSGQDAKRAQRELQRRASGQRASSGAPIPGSGGGGAWFGKKADGSSGHMDPKWDDLGEARKRLNEAGTHRDQDKLNAITGQETLNGTSVFDPVLCELAYRWFTAPGQRVLDPFAGGSVRGIVASVLQRHYFGVELREAQVLANREQAETICREAGWRPRWLAGDSLEALDRVPPRSVDFIFSCPPYADLEVYSDDPRDISGMPYERFLETHGAIIGKAARALREDRFAAWVISDVRDKGGHYRGLVHAAVRAFEEAGLRFYNEAIILDPVGSAAIRSGRIFLGGRKLTRMHQVMLVFVKGNWKRATEALAAQEQVLEPPGRAAE